MVHELIVLVTLLRPDKFHTGTYLAKTP